MMILIVGLIASFSSTVSLFPQLYRAYTTKSTDDISMGMLINFVICSLSWIAYGLLTDSVTVWATNVIMALSSVVMIVMKLKYARKVVEDGQENT